MNVCKKKKKKKSSAALGKSLHFQLNVLKDRGIKRSLAIYIKCKKNITNMILRENKYRLLEQGYMGTDFKIVQ